MAELELVQFEETRDCKEMATERCSGQSSKSIAGDREISEILDVEEAESQLRRTATVHDGELDPLGDPQGEINYKSMSWWHVGMLMIAETISLGILSLPGAVAHLGLVPGILSIVLLGILATYSGYVVGQFKLRHPSVHSFADAGFILFGTLGYHVFCWAALLSLIFIMAAHILTFSVAMNVLTDHAACSILWAVIGSVISVFLTLPRTLKNVSYFSILSFLSITSAVLLVTISLGVTKHTSSKAAATDVYVFLPSYTLTPTFLAILNICIAFMGNVAFFGFISELRDPRSFPKALVLQQSVSISFYLVVGCVVYQFVGTAHMVSPALGAASPSVQKIAYGIAMPTIIVAGVINAHVSCKQVYIQLWQWRGEPEIVSKKNLRAVGSWIGVVVCQWIVALVLALSIPVFEQMLGLISALFGSWFTYGICGMLWFSLNADRIFGRAVDRDSNGVDVREGCSAEATKKGAADPQIIPVDMISPPSGFFARMGKKKLALLALNIFMVFVGSTLCVLGLYTSVKAIMESEVGEAFSCGSV